MTDWQAYLNDYNYKKSFGTIPLPGGAHQIASGSDVALSTTEAVITTLTPTVLKANNKVTIVGWAAIAVAAASTNPIVTIRRGTLVTDPIVGEAITYTVAASSTTSCTIIVTDTPIVDNQSYILTGDMTTGTGTALSYALYMIPMN